MTDENVVRNRLGLLPPIRRARLWRLYAEDRSARGPSRFLDLWMDGGRSILGAKGTGIGTAAKAAIDVGLTRPFPSILEARLGRSLAKRYGEWAAVRLFRNEERALAAAAAILPPGGELEILMPFAEHHRLDADRAAPGPNAATTRVAMPRLPCPAALAPGILLLGEVEAAPEGDLVPPLILACAHRALSEFDRFAKEYDERLWKRVDRRLAPFFERRGPYLYPRTAEEDYGDFFVAALGAGALLSPCAELPSIIPGDFDDGEIAGLAKALQGLSG
jgi:hypothetical protein